jgi:hypothetical protein
MATTVDGCVWTWGKQPGEGPASIPYASRHLPNRPRLANVVEQPRPVPAPAPQRGAVWHDGAGVQPVAAGPGNTLAAAGGLRPPRPACDLCRGGWSGWLSSCDPPGPAQACCIGGAPRTPRARASLNRPRLQRRSRPQCHPAANARAAVRPPRVAARADGSAAALRGRYGCLGPARGCTASGTASRCASRPHTRLCGPPRASAAPPRCARRRRR